MNESKDILIDYTNWKGNRRWRRVRSLALAFSSSMYHPERQWLLKALDLEDANTVKYFSMKDIHTWRSSDGNVLSPSNCGPSSE